MRMQTVMGVAGWTMSNCTEATERRGVGVVCHPCRDIGDLAILPLLSVPLRAGSRAMTRTTCIAALIAALSAPLPASAVAYSCVGKVDRVSLGPTGEVNASFSFHTGVMAWQGMCSLNADYHAVTPAACKAVLAVLTAARLSGQQVEMWFDNSTGGSCNAPPWQPIKNMGWYWGPSMFP